MTKIFDYIYYRINKAYFKWDGRNGITSIIGLSMIQSMLIADCFAIIIKQIFDRDQLIPFAKTIAAGWTIIFFIFLVWNFFRYKDKYNFLKNKWKTETKTIRIIRGWAVFGSLVLPWLILFLFVV
ncbi:hypothetical protein [Pedobacter nanyangensis]|uniref:hypothetical protein n=1 Tax=Pedobacter nanyangensis TaxID=1562389 RepID=UPI000DE51C1F|nr:hypothetical protein [Pedobacter nanyangensis]